MKKNTTAMVLGILFGVCVIILSYFNLVLAIAFAFAKKAAWFGYTPYIYPVLGIIAIVGSALARKNIKATRVLLTIPCIAHLAVTIYVIISGIVTDSFLYLLVYLVVVMLGIISTIFAFLAKNRENYQSPPPSFTPPSQSAQM